MAEKLEGQVAFVTGAARGQGRSHAVRMAEEGADIIALDLCENVKTVEYELATPEDLEETVRLVESQDRRIVAAKADVRDYEAVEKVVADGVEKLGRLDIVLANAGVTGPYKEIAATSSEEWSALIDIDLTGVFNTVKAAIPHVRKGGRGGSFVLTSSIIGVRPQPGAGAYVSAKAALVGLMKSLALELAPDMIRVNSIHPTQAETKMIMNQLHYDLFSAESSDRVPTADDFAPVSESFHALPIPWVQASDITNAVMFLVSDEGKYITGTILPIDAGAWIK